MINSKKELREWLEYEKSFYFTSNKVKNIYYILIKNEKSILWTFQKKLRYTEYYKNTNKKIRYIISLKCLNYYRNKYLLHIEPNVFDKGLHIMHLGSILTNSNARVGQNCAIHINTSLVANGVSNGTPQLGDDIVIGVGTNIVGNIKIANGIAIGANSLVNKSFDENDICIAGVPAKKISNNGRKNWGTKIETY